MFFVFPISEWSFCSPTFNCKDFAGLKLHSYSIFGSRKPNLTVEFHDKVQKSLLSRTCTKPTRARIGMTPIGTPRVPYRTPGEGTWQWVDLWNALYRERVIFIGQEVDEELSNQILATMLYLDSMNSSKMLYLYINGPGGDLTPCMAIYDTMQSLKSPVGTHCLGYAYNLPGFLLAAGDKRSRFAMPLSRIALQSPAGAARGQADDIRNEADELLRIRDYLFEELSKKTGQPVEKSRTPLLHCSAPLATVKISAAALVGRCCCSLNSSHILTRLLSSFCSSLSLEISHFRLIRI